MSKRPASASDTSETDVSEMWYKKPRILCESRMRIDSSSSSIASESPVKVFTEKNTFANYCTIHGIFSNFSHIGACLALKT